MKVESKCKHCRKHIGGVVYGDVYCNCGHYNIIRPNKETVLKVKQLHKPMTTALPMID